VTDAGMVIEVRPEFSNTASSMVVNVLGRYRDLRSQHVLNAFFLRVVKVLFIPIATVVSFLQLPKVAVSITFTASGILTVTSTLQPKKADFPMVVIVLGRLTAER
jgi:hypothetical protein